jgi:hypothetical protein
LATYGIGVLNDRLASWQQDISMVSVPEEHRRAQQRFGHLFKN